MAIYDAISKTLAKQGINVMVGEMQDFISIWKQWYRGNVNDFHYYDVKMANGTTKQIERLTLNMAKKISEDYSKLLWTEKTSIELDSKEKTAQLWEVLDSKVNNFSVNFPRFLEKSFALGTGMLVQYLQNDEIIIDYIDGDLLLPLESDNSYIRSVLTISQFTEIEKGKEVYYTHLTIHSFDGAIYTKENQLYKSKSNDELGKKIPFESKFSDVKEYDEVITDTPHFQIFKPNIVNNLDLASPMGISVFANHLDKLKSLDTKYDSFNNEFILGVKRILVDRTSLKSSVQVDENTGELNNVMYFDANDRAYVAVSGMDQQPVKEIDFSLRSADHISSINADLNYLSAGVGLGQDYYNFDGSSAAKTATEVISENSDTFRTKENHQIIIKDVLHDLIKSICYLANIESKHIQITFDDSIVEDKDAEARRALIEYNAGLIDKIKYFEIAYQLEEAEAIKLVDLMEGRVQIEEVEEEPPIE